MDSTYGPTITTADRPTISPTITTADGPTISPMITTADGSTISLYMDTSIMYEILSRLPVKSLFKFKTVSKALLSIITDPGFARFRSRTRRSHIDGFFFLAKQPWGPPYPKNWEFVPSPNMKMDGYPTISSLNMCLQQRNDIVAVDVKDSCNGLVLLARYIGECPKATYCVCNPLTMEWATMPRPTSHSDSNLEFGLVVDPGSTHHFKVVCLIDPKHGNSFEDIKIYSSKIGKWMGHDLRLPLSHYIIGRSKTLFLGTLFWSCFESYILVCSIKEDRPWLINVPYAPMGRNLWISSDDRLLCCCHSVTGDHSFWSLDLDSDRRGWKIEHSTEYENMIQDISSIYPVSVRAPCPQFQIVGFDHGQDMIFLWVPHATLSYHVPTRRLDWIMGGLTKKFWMRSIAFPYVDSMVSSPLMKSIRAKKMNRRESWTGSSTFTECTSIRFW